MSQDRILGSSATLSIYGSNGRHVYIGELDSFNSEPEHELKKWHPLGQVEEHGQLVYKGYKLSFKGAKIDGEVEKIQEAIDDALLNGDQAPRYRIVETTILYDGEVEKWVYDNALVYNLKIDKSNAGDAIKQELSGWAPRKERG